GVVDFVPGWFMQGHKRPEDKLYTSKAFRDERTATFLKAITPTEMLINAVTALIAPDLYDIGREAIERLKTGDHLQTKHSNVSLWPSVFSGIEVISNRITPNHRDCDGTFEGYDLLLSGGSHSHAEMFLADLGANLAYQPGTVVGLCGKLLRHEVADWKGGERVCYAHFMRDAVHSRLGVRRAKWVEENIYHKLMSTEFLARQRGY
ncbi:hypothetical protein PLICRDRAFT_119745, partial [Plicaturopsis crispa FD-325 SS-3]